MSYSLRNTLLLLCMLIIIAAGGTYKISYRYRQITAGLEQQLEDRNGELEMLRAHNNNYDRVEARLYTAQSTWQTMHKRVYNEENSSVSFAYLNKFASQPDSRVSFKYRKNQLEPLKKGIISTNTYTLSGEASFLNLYRFVWKLEHYSPLYKLEELEIEKLNENTEKSVFESNKIRFIMTVHGFSVEQTGLDKQKAVSEKTPKKTLANPFHALVQKQLPPNKNNLLNVDKATLLGLIQSAAYFRDDTGRTRTLRNGDEVYLGKLTSIVPDEGTVEFTLNEGGFLRKVKLHLEYKDKIK